MCDLSETGHTYTLVLYGDGGVGKTCFLERLRTGHFERRYLATQGVELTSLVFDTSKGPVRFRVRDLAGQEKFGDFTAHFASADCAIAMYDVGSRTSFKNTAEWTRCFRRQAPRAPVVLVGTKVDISEDQKRVTLGDALRVARAGNYTAACHVSARTSHRLDSPFAALVHALLGPDAELQDA